MGKDDCDIRIGTSGWSYNHWYSRFYPEELPRGKWFEYYAEHFDTVEVNNTFYQLPKQITFENWRKRAPKNFLFTVKANRYITHIKRLRNVSAELERFFERAVLLKEKLGPVLYQLPPSMHKDLDLLGDFVKLLPKRRVAVLEFRHKSWYSDDAFKLLGKYKVGFCIHDLTGVQSPRIVTSDIVYVRFHGTTGRYAGNYSKSALQDWSDWLREQRKKVRRIFAYFNNDANAYAVNNAEQLREQLDG